MRDAARAAADMVRGLIECGYRSIVTLGEAGLAAAVIFAFCIAWNEYHLASALVDRDTMTVPILIVNNASQFDGLGTIFSTGMLLAIPPIIFTLFVRRPSITGMTAAAVKG